MKNNKFFFAVIMMAVVLVFTACGGGEKKVKAQDVLVTVPYSGTYTENVPVTAPRYGCSSCEDTAKVKKLGPLLAQPKLVRIDTIQRSYGGVRTVILNGDSLNAILNPSLVKEAEADSDGGGNFLKDADFTWIGKALGWLFQLAILLLLGWLFWEFLKFLNNLSRRTTVAHQQPIVVAPAQVAVQSQPTSPVTVSCAGQNTTIDVSQITKDLQKTGGKFNYEVKCTVDIPDQRKPAG